MDPNDLNDRSLLILADVAATDNGMRRHDRIATLLSGLGAAGSLMQKGTLPGCVRALVEAGLVQIIRCTPKKGEAPGWRIEITDKGQLIHRAFVANLRQAALSTPH